jgi:hypothetical protein
MQAIDNCVIVEVALTTKQPDSNFPKPIVFVNTDFECSNPSAIGQTITYSFFHTNGCTLVSHGHVTAEYIN